STRRRLFRGFDQAEVLARALAATLDRPCRPMFQRVDPLEQASRSHRERRAAAGAFRLGSVAPGNRILLVDDVLTTGASISCCADELLCGGAHSVWALAATGR
ncbi:MAG: ComF family protein, partial [Myxococcota bacterium]|nr:ComF family protein [Myxococcota bacterium]